MARRIASIFSECAAIPSGNAIGLTGISPSCRVTYHCHGYRSRPCRCCAPASAVETARDRCDGTPTNTSERPSDHAYQWKQVCLVAVVFHARRKGRRSRWASGRLTIGTSVCGRNERSFMASRPSALKCFEVFARAPNYHAITDY
jgi:hypothetical protein